MSPKRAQSPRSPSARDPAGARERLLLASAAVFRECGYRAASLDEILRRSKVAKSNFYYHFAGKLELACAAVDLWLFSLGQTLMPVLESPARSGLQRLRAFVRAFEAECREGPAGCPFGMLAAEEDLEPPLRDRVQRALDVLERGFCQALEAGIQDGSIRAGTDARKLSTALVAAVQGGGLMARAAGDPGRISGAVEPLLRLISA